MNIVETSRIQLYAAFRRMVDENHTGIIEDTCDKLPVRSETLCPQSP